MTRPPPSVRLVLAALSLLLGAAGCTAEEPPPGPAASAEEARPLEVGAALPDVELRDVDGRPVRLRTLARDGAIALVFYRGGW